MRAKANTKPFFRFQKTGEVKKELPCRSFVQYNYLYLNFFAKNPKVREVVIKAL